MNILKIFHPDFHNPGVDSDGASPETMMWAFIVLLLFFSFSNFSSIEQQEVLFIKGKFGILLHSSTFFNNLSPTEQNL